MPKDPKPGVVEVPERIWRAIQPWPAIVQRCRTQANFLCPPRVYEEANDIVDEWEATLRRFPVRRDDD